MNCNTAVFYDIENLICLFTVKNNTILHLDEIYRRILSVEGVNGVSVQKAYADWAVQINRNLRSYVLQIGIEPVQIFNTNQNDKVKNAADVSLIIDAVELLAKRPDIENYVIVSGDGIFAFLAKKLHEHGKRVIGCGFGRNTNVIFRNACDYFITLEKSDKTLTATSSKSALTSPVAPPPVVPDETAEEPAAEVPVEKAAPPAVNTNGTNANGANTNGANGANANGKKPKGGKPPKDTQLKFPKNKFSETLSNANIPVWKNTDDINGALLVIRDLVEVLFSHGTGENVDLENSVFKTYVDIYVQGFKVSHYKFKRFGEFMRFVLTGSPYCLYTTDGTTLKIAQRGAVVSKGSILVDMRGLQITLADGTKLTSFFEVPDHVPFTYTIPLGQKATQVAVAPPVPATEASTTEPNEPVDTGAADTSTPHADTTDTAEDAALSKESQKLPDRPGAPAHEAPAEEFESVDEGDDSLEEGLEEGSVRKWIKSNLMRLSLDNAISPREIKRLLTAEYSHEVFGIKAPIFKEVVTRSNLNEQRMINGKVKYWKETFKYNGKSYLVYKEWIATIHRDRFNAWLKKLGKKSK